MATRGKPRTVQLRQKRAAVGTACAAQKVPPAQRQVAATGTHQG